MMTIVLFGLYSYTWFVLRVKKKLLSISNSFHLSELYSYSSVTIITVMRRLNTRSSLVQMLVRLVDCWCCSVKVIEKTQPWLHEYINGDRGIS